LNIFGESMPTRDAICWTYWYSALISQILTPKSYHRLGVIDIFSVCCGYFGIFWNIWLFRVSDLFQKIRIQLPLEKVVLLNLSIHAPFVLPGMELYSVRRILKSVPKILERSWARARFHPKNSASGWDRRGLVHTLRPCTPAHSI
jgi:hypothetical protein